MKSEKTNITEDEIEFIGAVYDALKRRRPELGHHTLGLYTLWAILNGVDPSSAPLRKKIKDVSDVFNALEIRKEPIPEIKDAWHGDEDCITGEMGTVKS